MPVAAAGIVPDPEDAGASLRGALATALEAVTATAGMAGLNVLTYLTACPDACGRNGGNPLTGPELERFLPWKAAPRRPPRLRAG